MRNTRSVLGGDGGVSSPTARPDASSRGSHLPLAVRLALLVAVLGQFGSLASSAVRAQDAPPPTAPKPLPSSLIRYPSSFREVGALVQDNQREQQVEEEERRLGGTEEPSIAPRHEQTSALGHVMDATDWHFFETLGLNWH